MVVKVVLVLLVFSVVAAGAVQAAALGPAVQPAEGPHIVSAYKAIFSAPPQRIPSDCAIDAPLMGNGDLLVAIGGGPQNPQLYINKNDLWVTSLAGGSHPMPLARLDLDLPALQDASYRVEQNLLQGFTTGSYTKSGTTLTMETAVSATENLLWIKLSAQGGAFTGNAKLFLLGDAGKMPPLTGGTGRVQLGREQYGNGRYYFGGAMDGITIYDRALSDAEMQKLAAGEALDQGMLRKWNFEASGNTAGVRGKAMAFNGTTTFVDSEPLTPGKGITVGGFVKLNHPPAAGDAQYLVSQGEWTKDWSLGISGGNLRMSIGGQFVESVDAVPAGKWVHLAGTYDGETVRVFIDGKDANPKPAALMGMQIVERRFVEKERPLPSAAACAVRVVSGAVGDGGEFKVVPGQDVLIVATAASLRESEEYREIAAKYAEAFKSADLDDLRTAHQEWWQNFWGKSFVEVPDKTLEQRYYLSQYAMGCASRLASFPPDLYGWETTDGPKWNGAYFLNYNFYAPFYGLYAANRIEQADPCIDAIVDAIDLGRRYSEGPEAGIRGGILLPVAIGPKGTVSAPMTWHQKSDSSYACVPIASRWYATYDLDFARKAYPFVKGVAFFWEKWLKFENSRYVDRDDAVLEAYGQDPNPCGQINPLQTLALIKQVMNLAIDMSKELRVDEDRRAKWADIRDHLSDYPTCTVRDLPPGSRIDEPRTAEVLHLPIFRYSEVGPAWQNSNAVGIQHIFPGNGIGLDSPPELLARARNQVRTLGRWIDLNGCNSFYPAAARVGYDPEIILRNLRHWVETSSPNGMRPDNPHGMEQFSVVPCTLQEMLFQSYDGVLRFFPDWPKNQDARFGSLRARGAFLVTAELKDGVIGGVKIVSEKGRRCTVVNPWPGQTVQLIRDEKPSESVSGNRFTFDTQMGETVMLEPGKPPAGRTS